MWKTLNRLKYSIIQNYSQIFSPKVIFLLSKKLPTDAIHTAKINDVAYCICEYSTKTNTRDSWIIRP